MAIGDVTSNERGSGARYNDGKAPLQYVPARVLACLSEHHLLLPHRITQALCHLAAFEESGGESRLEGALLALGGSESSFDVVNDAARVFEYGARKYAPWNWAKGMPWSVPLACAKRHLLAVLNGEELDAESGLPHTAHAACNVIMLMHYKVHYPEGNDLPPREVFSRV